MRKFVVLFLLSCLGYTVLQGQCPGRDSLIRQLLQLKAGAPGKPVAIRHALGQLEKDFIRCGYWNDTTQAQLLRALATTYLYEGDHAGMIPLLRQAANLITRSSYKRADDGRDLVQLYYYLAVSYREVYNVPEAMIALDSCIAASRKFSYVDRSSLKALYDRGEYYLNMGDYHRCIEFFQECNTAANGYLSRAMNAGDSSVTMEYAHSSFSWMVNANIALRQYDIAERLLNDKVNNQGLRRTSAYQGTYLGLRAEVELHQGRYDRAVQDLQKALSVEQKAFSRKQLLNTLANEVYFRHQKNYERALATFRQALSTINKDPDQYKADSMESVNIWSNMAELYAQRGQFDLAQISIRNALQFIEPGITTAEIIRRPPAAFMSQKKTHYLTGLFVERGNTWRRKYQLKGDTADLTRAITAYKEADQLVNRIKLEQANLNSKLFWRRSSHGLYEAALEACYLSGNFADAFYFFEKSRAVLLNDQLADQRWMGKDDIILQTQLQKQIYALNRKLEDPALSPREQGGLLAEKAAHQQRLDRLGVMIKQRNPFYYQSFIDSNFISLAQVKNGILREYGALAEVFSGDSAVYLLVIDAKHTQLRRIDKRAYDSLANRYIGYMTDLGKQNDQHETFSTIARQLHRLIFDGVTLPAGRLIISPDGPYFPFEALLTSGRPDSYLLRDHAISYTYSARYLLNDFSLPPGREAQAFMGVAPVQYGYAQLPELAESDNSLRSLTGYFRGADNFIGKAASRRNFLQHFTDYRVIQLYTHAMDDKVDGEPRIYFADSTLSLSELVSDSRPATSLVVLSACETGTGKFYQGEGVFSFNRGFAALGIPAAITSLWKADNRKTYILTSLFYKFLSAGEPADVALQQAKLEFMTNGSKENMLPYYWAVPVLTGKITDIPAAESSSWWLLIPAIALGLIVVVVAMGWWRKRNRTYTGQALVE